VRSTFEYRGSVLALYDAIVTILNVKGLDPWIVRPGERFSFRTKDPSSTPMAPSDRSKTEKATSALKAKLANQHALIQANQDRAVLIVLQAMDAGGKDGTVKGLYGGLNPAGAEVTSFGVPSEEERAHDVLWRIHKRLPAKGRVGIFNRSHYEDVLGVRVFSISTISSPRSQRRAPLS
jgi:polyphosphate kinase 2 (PPK2 family)